MRFLVGSVCLAVLACIPAKAMQIDKMMLVSRGVDSSDHYTVTNNTKHPLFITTMVEELDITKDSVNTTKYTAENLNSWKISINPARFVIFPNESKIVYVSENECVNPQDCYRSKDAVFAVNLVPSVYTPEGEVPRNNVGVLFGFSPTYVIPSSNPDVKYDISLAKNKDGNDVLKFDNQGNTFLTVMINQCGQKHEEGQNCSTYSRIFGSRVGELPLPLNYEKGELKVKVVSGLEEYVKDYTI